MKIVLIEGRSVSLEYESLF